MAYVYFDSNGNLKAATPAPSNGVKSDDDVYLYITKLGKQLTGADLKTANANLVETTNFLATEDASTSWSEILDSRVSKIYNTPLYKPSMFIPALFRAPDMLTRADAEAVAADKSSSNSKSKVSEWFAGNLHLINKIEGINGLNTGVIDVDDATSSFKFSPGNNPYKHKLTITWIEDANLSVTKAHSRWQRIVYDDAAHTVKSFGVNFSEGAKASEADLFGSLGLVQYTPVNNAEVGICGKIVVAGLFPIKIDKPFQEIGPGVKAKELPTVKVEYVFAKAWYSYFDSPNSQQIMVLSN